MRGLLKLPAKLLIVKRRGLVKESLEAGRSKHKRIRGYIFTRKEFRCPIRLCEGRQSIHEVKIRDEHCEVRASISTVRRGSKHVSWQEPK